MKHILLIPNMTKDRSREVCNMACRVLSDCGAVIYIDPAYEQDLQPNSAIEYCKVPPKSPQLVLVIGGDGSVLDAVETAKQYQIPILGINLGKMGYLAELESDRLDELKRLFTGDYMVQNKMTLTLRHISPDGKVTTYDKVALNEVAVTHNSPIGIAKMMLIDTNGEKIPYRSDGLILATPSGSTAYSFSAGGPIINSDVECICATPICSHSFVRQAIVFSKNSVLKVKNTSNRSHLNVSTDGRPVTVLSPGDMIEVTCSQRPVSMLYFNTHSTFQTLKKKMAQMESGEYSDEK